MTKNLFWGILSMTLVLASAIGGCNTKADNQSIKEDGTTTVNIPSSSYPVDIVGQVIISQKVIANQKEYKLNGQEYWIVQTSIRNKSYQTEVKSNGNWSIGKQSNPNYFAGGLIMDTGQQIEQGKSGTVTLCFSVTAVGLNPNDHQLRLGGWARNINNKIVQIPNSYGELVDTKAIAETYDWNSQKIIVMSGQRVIVKIDIPSGTYTATSMGLTETANFKGNNTLEMYNEFDGKRVFHYSISSAGTSITTTNIVTNKTSTTSFRYIKDNECVVIGNLSFFK